MFSSRCGTAPQMTRHPTGGIVEQNWEIHPITGDLSDVTNMSEISDSHVGWDSPKWGFRVSLEMGLSKIVSEESIKIIQNAWK